MTSRYDALLTFPGMNWETDSIRNKMVNSQLVALSGFQRISPRVQVAIIVRDADLGTIDKTAWSPQEHPDPLLDMLSPWDV